MKSRLHLIHLIQSSLIIHSIYLCSTQEMDILALFFVPAAEMKYYFDISPSIAFTYYSGNIRRPSPQIDAKHSLKAYLSPFTAGVWGWISLVAIANVLAWAMVRRFNHRQQTLSSNARKTAISLWKSLFDTLSVMPNQGRQYRSNTICDR